jgi:hypothetical protein
LNQSSDTNLQFANGNHSRGIRNAQHSREILRQSGKIIPIMSWLTGKEMATYLVSQLGFLRISMNPKGLNAEMAGTRQLLSPEA